MSDSDSDISDADCDMSTADSDVALPPEIIDELYSIYPEQLLEAMEKLRRLLSDVPAPIDKVIEAGVVPKFIEFLQRDDDLPLQYEAACILTTITAGTSPQTKIVVEAGAVPIFIRLLDSECEDIQEQAALALGNVAGDGPEYRDYVLDQGTLTPLLQLLSKSTTMSTTRNTVWALTTLCRGKNPPPKFEQISPCLPVLSRLLFHCDADVLADACWTLSYISGGANDRIQTVIEAGVCKRLVELLMHNNDMVVCAVLQAVGNIVTGDDVQKQVILDCNALPCLSYILTSHKEKIRREACWTISNITVGNRQQIQAVIDANIFPVLIEILTKGEFKIKTKKEAASAIANATSGGLPQQVRYLVEQGCIPPLCELLTLMDAEIVQVALNGLENILRLGEQEATLNGFENILRLDEQEAKATGGVNSYAVLIQGCKGFDKMECLQSHESKEISQKAIDMIERYFDTKEEDAVIAP